MCDRSQDKAHPKVAANGHTGADSDLPGPSDVIAMPRVLAFIRAHRPEVALTGLTMLVWAWIRHDYGSTWDDAFELEYGEVVRQYFAGGFDPRPSDTFHVYNMKFNDPGIDLLIAVLAHAWHVPAFTLVGSVVGAFWVASYWPVCQLGRKLSGDLGAWFAGMALLGLPTYLGHGFIHHKGLPLACAVAWLWWASTWAAQRRAGLSSALVQGLAFSPVLLVRPGAWFLGALLAIAALARVIARDSSTRVMLTLAGAVILAWLLMVAPWPYAHESPLLHPLEAMRYSSHFDRTYRVLYRGKVWSSAALPADYLAGYLCLTTPPFVLALAIFGVGAAVFRACPSGAERVSLVGGLFILFVPLTAFVILRPAAYTGMRHFLFLLPAVAVFASVGASQIAEWIPASWGRPATRMAVPSILLALGLPACAELHPYEYIYLNLFAGDRQKLAERFDMDYWVTSYREAAEWISAQPTVPRHPPTIAVAANEGSVWALANWLPPGLAVEQITDDLRHVPWLEGTSYYVGCVGGGMWRNFPAGPVVKTIERDGILLAVVRAAPAPPMR